MMRNHQKGCTQVAVNNTLTLPEHKPDIEFLLRATSTPCLDKTSVVDKKIIFSGHILIGVEYVACVPSCSQPIHFVSFEVPFNGFIDYCHARACMSAQLNVSIEFQDFQALDPETIKKLIIVKICVIKIAKNGEPLPHHCCLPCPTICQSDKAFPCNHSPLPCPSPPEHTKQKCYIPDAHDYQPINHYHNQTSYESNCCDICGCDIDKEM